MITAQVLENFSDPLWRLNNLYWIVDETGKKVPFRLNPQQHKLYAEFWYYNLVLKSRQHGITTFSDILGLDQALFNNNFSVGICAHTREDVEKIFRTKIRFPYENLPLGLKNARPANTETAKMLVFNNGSSVEVATSLRSGTYQYAHISEFGKICAKYPDKAKEIVTGTFETVHPGSYLIVESTAEGREGYFYQYVMDALKRWQAGTKPNKLQFKLHFFAWFEDKRNILNVDNMLISRELERYFTKIESELGIKLSDGQRAWYAAKSETLQEDMKREHPSTIDEAFEAAISGAYLSKQMAWLRKRGKLTVVPHDPDVTTQTAWDFGLSDQMCIWLHQLVGGEHHIIGYIQGTDDDILYYWRELKKLDYNWGKHYLPHDAGTRRIGSARSADEAPRTIEQILHGAGMRNICVVPKIEDKWTAIQETKLFLPKCLIDYKNCEDGVKGLDNFRREWDDKIGDWKNRPHHDWAMHPYDAMETLARGFNKFGVDIINFNQNEILPDYEEVY